MVIQDEIDEYYLDDVDKLHGFTYRGVALAATPCQPPEI